MNFSALEQKAKEAQDKEGWAIIEFFQAAATYVEHHKHDLTEIDRRRFIALFDLYLPWIKDPLQTLLTYFITHTARDPLS